MKQKVFLSGSTSFLGTKFIEIFGSRFEILGIARSDKNNPIDLLDFDSVSSAFNDFNPDTIIHLAADLGRDAATSDAIIKTNPGITKNLVKLAQSRNIPFIFTSTEAVYGGKENIGNYVETDELKPRSPYGASKVESEKIITESGLPYLITRGHRYIGISKNFNQSKQFLDTLNELSAGRKVHLDSKKYFKPVLINNLCEILNHHLLNHLDEQVVINVGIDKPTTYFDLLNDIALKLGIDTSLIEPDGEEIGWPMNSTLSLTKMQELGYPIVTYDEMLLKLASEF